MPYPRQRGEGGVRPRVILASFLHWRGYLVILRGVLFLAGTCQLHSHKVMDGLVTNLPVLTWRGSLSFSLFLVCFFFKQNLHTTWKADYSKASCVHIALAMERGRWIDWWRWFSSSSSALTYCSPTEIAASHSHGLRPKQMSGILPRTMRCCTFTNYFIIMQSLSPFSMTFQLRNLTQI